MRRPDSARGPAFLVVCALLSLVTACGAADGAADPDATAQGLRDVRVTGAIGERPQVAFRKPLSFAESGWRTLERGEGPTVGPNEELLLQLTLVNARTGEVAVTTSEEGQSARLVRRNDDELFPVLTQALGDARAGSRVLVGAAPEDAYAETGAPQYGIGQDDSVLMIADVISASPDEVRDRPEGTAIDSPEGLPTVVEHAGVVEGVRFGRGDRLPRRLTSVLLIEGDGPPVREDSLITIDTLGQVWGAPRVVSTTYAKEPITVAIGTGDVIPGWDRALVGVPEGSRVLLVVPPHLAYGRTGSAPAIPSDATLVYVIDVLGTS